MPCVLTVGIPLAIFHEQKLGGGREGGGQRERATSGFNFVLKVSWAIR